MKVKNKETLFQSYLKMEKITLEHDDKTFIRERLDKKNAVAGLVYNTNTKKFIFVSQWRPGPLDYIIEIPAGVKDVVGEDSANCMIREINEEIGYSVNNIIQLMPEFYLSPGYTNEKMTLFYCEVSEKINDGGGCESEDEYIDIIEMTLEEMLDYNFIDVKTILAIKSYM